MKDTTFTLIDRKQHTLSFSRFHLLAAEDSSIRKKWGSLSQQTKENIFLYFQYLRGLVEIHDSNNYDNYTYWKKWFIEFMRKFDEDSPCYDGNFEKAVLQNKALMKDLKQ